KSVDVFTYLGTFGLFFTFFILFMRFLPMIAIAETKGVTAHADPHHPLGGGHHSAMEPPKNSYGLLAEFATPAEILHAAERIRDAGFRRWDVFTPFPVHGMN